MYLSVLSYFASGWMTMGGGRGSLAAALVRRARGGAAHDLVSHA